MPLNNDSLWQDGHSAIAGNLLDNGYEFKIGLLNVKSLKERWSLVDQVYGGSMVISLKSFNKKNKVKRYNPFSTNPSSKKDLSLIVEKQILVSEVIKELKEFCQEVTESFECEAIDVFDVYDGDGLGDNERSITVSMTFRAQDRTLKDKEVNSAFEKIQSLVQDNTNYKIRK